MNERGHPPRTLAESTALAERGGWCLEVGSGYLDDRHAAFGWTPARGAYNGHLVVLVDQRWLLDPTLGQTTCVDHGIVTGPLVVDLGSHVRRQGFQNAAGIYRWGTHPPVRIVYEAVLTDLSYRSTPAWRIADAAFLAMRKRTLMAVD